MSKRIKDGMVYQNTPSGLIADIAIYTILLAVMFAAVVPMWHTFMASVSEGNRLIAHEGVAWLPVTLSGKANWAGYAKTLRYENYAILKSYGVTLFYVAANVLFGLTLNIIGGYVLYRKPRLSPVFTMILMFTLLFGGGMVPTYMVLKNLRMTASPLSLIIPNCTNAMFLMMLMNAFRQAPQSTVESAELDGAGHFTVMFRVLLPQAMGLTVVVIINTAIMTWNSWFEASIYVPQQREFWPLQLWIKQMVADNAAILTTTSPDWNRYLISYCVILVATLPVLIAMPFAQKKLQKGAFLGAV
jgi:putative aldouronate transport system permease protein